MDLYFISNRINLLSSGWAAALTLLSAGWIVGFLWIQDLLALPDESAHYKNHQKEDYFEKAYQISLCS